MPKKTRGFVVGVRSRNKVVVLSRLMSVVLGFDET